MFGSFFGNAAGTLYFLIYQLAGILFAFMIFKKENRWFKLLFGSVIGSFLIHWLPTLMAFLMNFTIESHISALVLLVLLFVAALYFDKRNSDKNNHFDKKSDKSVISDVSGKKENSTVDKIKQLEIEIEENNQRKEFTDEELMNGYLKLEKLNNPNFFVRLWNWIKNIFATIGKFFKKLFSSKR